LTSAAAPFSVIAACLGLAWFEGGFAATRWGPVAVVLLCLLALSVWYGGFSTGTRLTSATVMFGALTLFVAWNFASIAWADFPDDALVGAGKTLLYATCFCLCALGQPRALRRLLMGFGFGVAAIAAVTLYRVALAGHPSAFFVADRLSPPIDYENANVCLWMMAYSALLFLGAGSGGLRLRAASLGAMALLLDISILGESRAWFYLLPIVVIGALVLSRERWRTLTALAVSGGAAAGAAPAFSAVYRDGPQPGNVHHAAVIGTLVALAAAAAGAAWVLVEQRYPTLAGRRVRFAAAALLAVALVVTVAVAFARVPRLAHPVALLSSKWHDFKKPYEPTNPRASRFVVSLSNDRWREWTVAWKAFEAHPLVGVGADNYEAYYLRDRADALFDPRYPHSIPLRLLSQLGIVGAALFAVFAGCAVWRGLGSRRRDAVGGQVAAAGLLVAGYWFLHGCVDWFWEVPALAAPAFGFLGAAARLNLAWSPAVAHRWPRFAAAAIAAAALLVLPPWFQGYLTDDATASSTPPATAYRDLRWAAHVNPLSADPYLVLGSIALNEGDDARAASAFEKAVRREPKGWYAYLQLATVAVQERRFTEAERWVEKARRRNPKDPETALADRLIRRRIAFSPSLMNGLYLTQLTHRFGR
jgi:O-Antigen ligase/Tetratricopeptide repeat